MSVNADIFAALMRYIVSDVNGSTHIQNCANKLEKYVAASGLFSGNTELHESR